MDLIKFTQSPINPHTNSTNTIQGNKIEFKKFTEILNKIISSFKINSLSFMNR